MKECFNCKELLPLSEYKVSRKSGLLKSDLGRCRVCRKCELERAIRDLSTVKFNYEINKFEVIKFENENEVREYYDRQTN